MNRGVDESDEEFAFDSRPGVPSLLSSLLVMGEGCKATLESWTGFNLDTEDDAVESDDLLDVFDNKSSGSLKLGKCKGESKEGNFSE